MVAVIKSTFANIDIKVITGVAVAAGTVATAIWLLRRRNNSSRAREAGSEAEGILIELKNDHNPNLTPNPTNPSSSTTTTIQIKSALPEECKAIIAGKRFHGQGHRITNTLSPAEARAGPNQRLVKAFGVRNAFVAENFEEANEFRKKAEEKLYVEEEVWAEYARVAGEVVRGQLAGGGGERHKLFGFVQVMTMKMIRKVIWGVDPTVGDDVDEALGVLGREINEQWLQSKDEAYEGDFATRTEMREALMTVFPEWDGIDTETNPFNYLLPAYETLWRVVLRCFIEISVRGHPGGAHWSAVLRSFLAHPTREELENSSTSYAGPVSAMMIAKEVLRLYPPARRVYRLYQDEKGVRYSMAADIEAMQRDPELWAGEPLTFRPERWQGVTQKEEDHKWLPFASFPFRCPAKRHKGVAMPFGVSMIALLTGALLEATEGKWQCCGDFPPRGVPLDTGREAYQDVELHKLATTV